MAAFFSSKNFPKAQSAKPQPTNSSNNIKRATEQYVDPMTGLSASQLKLGYWWVTHKGFFQRAVLVALISIDAIFIMVSLYGWGNYLLVGVSANRRILDELSSQGIETNPARTERAPQEMQILSTHVFSAGDDKYDFVAEVVNPNTNWYVTFDMRFAFRGAETEWRKEFLLPNENSVRAELGFSFQSRPREPQVEIENIKWYRVSPHLTKDPAQFVKDRTRFEVREAQFISGGSAQGGLGGITSGGAAENAVHFIVKNLSPFNFWRVPFYVVMMRGGGVTGIETVTLEPFDTGTEHTVDLATTVSGSLVSEIRVLPVVNIFDYGVYRKE